MRKIVFIFGLFLFFLSTGYAEDQYNNFLNEITKKNRIPGLAVAIFNDEGITFSYAHGTLRTGNHINSRTSFFLGSTTKTITALAVMILDNEGKISINDPVKKYLSQFHFKDSSVFPGAENIITIAHLLSHTSGISDKGIPGPGMGERTLYEEFLRINNARLVSPPGEKYEYCNLNYRVLGYLIEQISGKSYGEFIKEKIFEPLSMNHSYSDPHDAFDLAEGFGQLFGFPIKRNQRFYPGALPSGYLISSVSDISTLLIEELRVSRKKQSIFPADMIRSTWEVPEGINGNYAKGWMKIMRDDGSSFLIHGGALENYQSFFYLDPSSNRGFVFMMNQGGFFPMINSFDKIRDGLIKIINEEEVLYHASGNIVNIILPLVVMSVQGLLFLLLNLWKRNIIKKKIWTKISIGLNVFWVIFFLFIFTPLMNIIMGDTASLSMIVNMFPELLIVMLLIIIPNIIRAGMKIRYLIIKIN